MLETGNGKRETGVTSPFMRIRLTPLLGAIVVAAIGLLALRRDSHKEVPVQPGTWHPAD